MVRGTMMMLMRQWQLCLFIAMIVAVSCVSTIYAQILTSSGRPTPIVVHSIVNERQINGSHLLMVAASGPPTQNCLRLTQHLLLRQEDDGRRNYVPLGAAVNGMGFSTAEDFEVTLEIPASIPKGKWQYVNRSVYFCTVFPGLARVTRAISAEKTIMLD